MKKKLVPIITVSLAAAFAAGPSFAHARPAPTAALTIPQDQEKPPEKPPEKPAHDPSAKPENPPAHEPDAKPPAKPEEKPRQEENPPNRPANNEEKPKPAPKPQDNNKAARNPNNDQNKKSVHAQANVHYSFRSQDKTALKQHFDAQIRSVNRSNRPHIRVGAFIPAESVTLIQPVPVEVIGLLPPIPEGCVVGFWDGFVVVYYPDDFYVVSYIDLL
jgi:outer membrane biosynthesis protein TonB